ncbi:unnamed protein product, partial [Closterium sp. NIES-53]
MLHLSNSFFRTHPPCMPHQRICTKDLVGTTVSSHTSPSPAPSLLIHPTCPTRENDFAVLCPNCTDLWCSKSLESQPYLHCGPSQNNCYFTHLLFYSSPTCPTREYDFTVLCPNSTDCMVEQSLESQFCIACHSFCQSCIPPPAAPSSAAPSSAAPSSAAPSSAAPSSAAPSSAAPSSAAPSSESPPIDEPPYTSPSIAPPSFSPQSAPPPGSGTYNTENPTSPGTSTSSGTTNIVDNSVQSSSNANSTASSSSSGMSTGAIVGIVVGVILVVVGGIAIVFIGIQCCKKTE